MKPCPACLQQAEWRYRYKEGWAALACADWFSGKCEGDPLAVGPPSVGWGVLGRWVCCSDGGAKVTADVIRRYIRLHEAKKRGGEQVDLL